MKRSGEDITDGISSIKRTKSDQHEATHTTSTFDAANGRLAKDVYEQGLDLNVDAFLTLKVFMKWDNNPEKLLLQVHDQAVEDGEKVSLEVFFLRPCVQYFKSIGLKFNFGDVFRLSLKGATTKDTSRRSSGPRQLMTLTYEDGVCLEFQSKKQPLAFDSIIDTWKALRYHRTGDAPFQDDWFSTPPSPLNPANNNAPKEPSQLEGTSLISKRPLVPEDSPQPDDADIAMAELAPASNTRASSTVDQRRDAFPKKLYRDTNPNKRRTTSISTASRKESSTTPESPGSSSKVASTSAHPKEASKVADSALGSKKAAKKAQRESRRAAVNGEVAPAEPSMPVARSSSPPRQSLEQHPTPPPARTMTLTQSKSTASQSSPAPSSSSIATQPLMISTSTATQSKPGVHVVNLREIDPAGSWCPLDRLQLGRLPCLIGIVAAVGSVNMSAKSENYRRVTIVDPTNVDRDSLTSGFPLTCFAKRAKEHLPDPVVGDVLIIRDSMIESHRGGKLCGSCPSYKQWSWTIFHPDDGTLRSGGTAVSPNAAQPMLTQQENQYCVRLADWWIEVSKERKSEQTNDDVIVHRISIADTGKGGGREHKLIKDASPHAPPSGYFDCTVEVLHGHMNDNGVYSLYVTDYTHNDAIASVQASWCIPALTDLIFKIELWNEASVIGPDMQPGEYYEIKNVRMKESTGGYWEGSFSEVKKLRKLDEDSLEEVPHLVELLRRKKAWQDESDANGTHKFPHMLIKDARPDSHFDCTVEVLRISPKGEGRALLYVTDYTPRNDLSFIAATADWTRGIEHEKILKVALFNAQAKAVESLRDGDFIAIRKMRLKAAIGGTLSGLLGGEERLIFKLDPRTTGNEDCLELQRRKDAWEAIQRRKEEKPKRKKKALPKKSLVQNVETIKERKRRIIPARLPKTTCLKDLQNVHKDSTPGRYLVLARVVDYWPDNIEDFVSLYCSNCEQEIPANLRICTDCDSDMADIYVRPYYKFSLILEDDEGTRLSVASASTKEKTYGFLQNFDPVDSREDTDALDAFKKTLEPLFGAELVHKHHELVQNSVDDDLDPESPFHNVVLAKLADQEGFFFYDYTPASQQTEL